LYEKKSKVFGKTETYNSFRLRAGVFHQPTRKSGLTLRDIKAV
jgi:hypothetical protein